MEIEDRAGNTVLVLSVYQTTLTLVLLVLVSALYNKQEFSILSSPKEYWVCGIVQAKLMKIMEEHLNFSE